MPWRPTFENPIRNLRLDAYRHRAAELRDAAGNLGSMYVEPELMAELVEGHLWWRKWRAREHVILWVEEPGVGGRSDCWIIADDLDEEIDRWEHGKSDYVGGTFRLAWLDEDASRRLRRELAIEDPEHD